MNTLLTTSVLLLLMGYFYLPWYISKKRNSKNRKKIVALSIILPKTWGRFPYLFTQRRRGRNNAGSVPYFFHI
jgi:hypothetical protein